MSKGKTDWRMRSCSSKLDPGRPARAIYLHSVPLSPPMSFGIRKLLPDRSLDREQYRDQFHSRVCFHAGPSGAPAFLTDKISTSSTSLSVVWRPPPKATLNGEFLGYQLTYRVAPTSPLPSRNSASGMTTININEDMLRIQVRTYALWPLSVSPRASIVISECHHQIFEGLSFFMAL